MKISAAIERAEANKRKYGGSWHVLRDGPFLYITITRAPGLNMEVIYSTYSPAPVKQSDNEAHLFVPEDPASDTTYTKGERDDE